MKEETLKFLCDEVCKGAIRTIDAQFKRIEEEYKESQHREMKKELLYALYEEFSNLFRE